VIIREKMRGFHDLLGWKPTFLFILGWSLISNASPLITVHISEFDGEDADVMELIAVPQVYAVLSWLICQCIIA
jgi:hypothetical protein